MRSKRNADFVFGAMLEILCILYLINAKRFTKECISNIQRSDKIMEEESTYITCLRNLVLEDPHRPYVIFVDKDLNQRVLTRQEVWDKSRRFAAVLKRLGLGKGDVICNTLVNSPERLLTYLGTVASGATPSQGQLFLADGQDLRHNLKESKAKAIIYDPKNSNGVKRIFDKIKFKAETGATGYKDLPDLVHVIEIEAKNVEDAQRWVNVIDKEEEMFVDENISKDDIAMIFLTSGTTGFSKLVPRTHHSLLTETALYRRAGLCKDDIWFVMQSLGWGGGFIFSFLSEGCKRVIIDVTNGLPDDMPLGHFVVNIFNQMNVNKTFLIPRDIRLVLDSCYNDLRINRLLDVIYTGGGPIYSATMDALGKITNTIHVVYSGTEFSSSSFFEVKKKSDFQDFCSGFPSSCNCQLKIVGEDGKELPPTEQGEILVHSNILFTGYLNNPLKTAEMFTEDGWCRTGDIGYFNEDGKLFVLCRKADAITKDGFTHYPGWMEKLINEYTGLENTVVVGIPDPVYQEEICLCMKPMPGVELSIDDVREHCKKLFLTSENDKMTPLPKYYLIFDDFITNENGKIQRKKMREEALKRLKLDKS